MQETSSGVVRELHEITNSTDTRDVLSHATRQAAAAYDDYFVVDIDAHVSEDQFWPEIIELIDNDVLRQIAQQQNRGFAGANALLNISPGLSLQSVGGRIGHQGRREPREPLGHEPLADGGHGFITAARRGMDALGLDYQVVFPSAMLLLGMHPQDEVEVALAGAFNRWMIETILPRDSRLKGLLYLPFNTPDACVDLVARYGAAEGIIGFTVCSTRNKPVHHDAYMRLYAMIQELGKPLAFHSGYHWGDPSFTQLNRFI